MRLFSTLLLVSASFCMLLALLFQTVTLATGDYRPILITSLALMVVADVCCLVVYLRGGRARLVAALIPAPSLFIVLDFLLRAPFAFG